MRISCSFYSRKGNLRAVHLRQPQDRRPDRLLRVERSGGKWRVYVYLDTFGDYVPSFAIAGPDGTMEKYKGADLDRETVRSAIAIAQVLQKELTHERNQSHT